MLAERLDVTVCSVAYHVRRLATEGLIELTAERTNRDAVEHFYGLSAAGESVLHAIAELEREPRLRGASLRARADGPTAVARQQRPRDDAGDDLAPPGVIGLGVLAARGEGDVDR